MAKSGRALPTRRDGRIKALDVPQPGGEGTIPFGVGLGRQDDFRQFGRFRQEEFLDDDVVALLSASARLGSSPAGSAATI